MADAKSGCFISLSLKNYLKCQDIQTDLNIVLIVTRTITL